MNNIEPYIIELRSQKVILDTHVAAIYGVETKRINEAVQRNLDKFPEGYILELSEREWLLLKSQFVASITEEKPPLKSQIATSKHKSVLKSQFATSSNIPLKGGKVKPPKAFTEKGLYMLATILKSNQATQATLQIVETFAKVREFSKVAKSLAIVKDKTKKMKLMEKSGQLIGDILNQEFAGEQSSETTIELNLAMIKIKHTIKKKKGEKRKNK